MKAIYPGTFDPVTLGHLNIIGRAAALFDHLVIAVANNCHKEAMFSVAQRKQFIKDSVSLPNCEVVSFDGLLVDYMQNNNIAICVRGVRNASDCVSECQYFHANSVLNASFEEVLLPTQLSFQAISSSVVREIIKNRGNIEKFVPKVVLAASIP